MRIILKFSAVALVAVCCQLLLEIGLGPLDEAQFAARVYIAHLNDVPMDDPDLIDAGTRLIQRQLARDLPGYKPCLPPAPRAIACAADEFGW